VSGDLVVGIDCSTTAAKAIVFDAGGAALASGRSELRLEMPRPGWHEQDPRWWWDAVRLATAEALAQVDASRIAAVAISHQRETFACLDAAGEPLRPAPLWLDARAGEQVRELGTERVHELSGKPPDVTPALYKLAWLRRYEPAALDRAAHITDVHGYLVHRLTGRHATSWASADPLGLLDMRRFGWAGELLDLVGISEEQLPEPVAPGEVLGEVTPPVAAQLGLPGPVPVVAGAGDGQAAGLAACAVDPGTAYLNLGTAVVSGTHAEEYLWSRAFRTLASPIAGAYTAETLLSSGTYLVRWFGERFGTGDPVPAEELQREAAALPAGAEGLLTLPYWNTAQTPYWDPFASGAVVGWRGVHGPAHLYRSLLEGVAFELRLQGEGVAEALGRPIARYLAMGGGTRSPLWLQLVADITGTPVTVCGETEATALGAAVLAATGAGLHPDVRTAAQAMASFGGTREPRADVRARYDRLFAAYRRLYPQLAEVMSVLGEEQK
jgi:xylulokinase